jgi:hypothetical protein
VRSSVDPIEAAAVAGDALAWLLRSTPHSQLHAWLDSPEGLQALAAALREKVALLWRERFAH